MNTRIIHVKFERPRTLKTEGEYHLLSVDDELVRIRKHDAQLVISPCGLVTGVSLPLGQAKEAGLIG